MWQVLFYSEDGMDGKKKYKERERASEHMHLREGSNRTQDYNLEVYYPANGEQGSSRWTPEGQDGVVDTHPSWVTSGTQSIGQKTEVLGRNGCPPAAP